MELDGLPSMVMPLPAMTLTFWPNEYVPGPGTYVTQYIYEDIVFTFFGVIACCDLWPLIPKASQHYEARYICDEN